MSQLSGVRFAQLQAKVALQIQSVCLQKEEVAGHLSFQLRRIEFRLSVSV